jgi:hypothetical protein
VLGSETAPAFHEGKDLLRQWLPRCEEMVVNGLGHPLQIADPDAVIPGIAAFLARHQL